jgi:ABC-2 type transport system ATP-binding protein
MEANHSILSIKNVTKNFGDFTAVKNLSLELLSGSICGLLGPNGAGKTTTIRMIMNIIIPDEGEIKILDKKMDEKLKDKIGYMPEERGLYPKMKIENLLNFFADIKGIPKNESKNRIDYWLKRLDLKDWSKKKVNELSKGMQQKIQFIITIFHEPELIILDEPFQGLDPINVQIFKDIILELKQKGKTILLSTHILEQAEKLCDGICLINKGKNILSGKLEQIKRNFSKNTITMKYQGNSDIFKNSNDIIKYNDYGNYIEIELQENVDPQSFLKNIIDKINIQKFEIMEPSLNQIFIESVKKSNLYG